MAAEAKKHTGTDFMNPANETIRAEFVRRNVLLCQTALVEKCLQDGIFENDDIINSYSYGETTFTDGDLFVPRTLADIEAKREAFNDEINGDDITAEREALITDDLRALRDLEEETEPQEIYEWWAVDSRFSELLQAKGEPIINNEFGIWWGRTTTGQAINMDELIHSICFDMEILDGQPRSWSKA